MTNLNKQILELIRNSEGHLTAEQAFIMAKQNNIDVSMASIYRILSKLANDGLIRKVSVSDNADIFDKTVSHHDHMICRICHKVVDIDIGDLKKEIEEKTGMEIDSYDLCLNYICDDCKKLMKNNQ